MSLEEKEWTPTLVCPPEKNPEGRTFFDWNDEKLKKWKADAIKMQELHVKDNNRTEWFEYNAEERDAIELRILMTVYGVRMPLDSTKGAPSCPLKTYTRDERLHARKIKKVIIKNSGFSEKIHFNVIYISTATKSEDEDEFFASEEPVFVVKKCRKYVDKDAKAYENYKEYKKNNNLPKGPMIGPQNGTYTPDNNGGDDDDGKVPLESDETPAASVIKRIRVVTDTVAMVGGIILGVAGVVTFFAPVAFSAAAMAAIQAGSFALTTYSIAGAVHGIYDKTSRDESIRTEVLLLASSAFSAYAGRINRYWKLEMGKYAREGKTFTEAAQNITRFQKNLFVAVNVITFVSSASSLLSSLVDLWNKKERSWLDYYQFCMSLFLSVNVLTKPITIQGVFESEQLQYLNQIQDTLRSDEAKKEMSNMLKEHSTSDQKAYMIRNLNKIENPTEFFELIKRTGSVVTCTTDGLTVNNKIPISPENYNEIGKSVFNDKIVQITRYEKTALHNSYLKEFGKDLPPEELKEFERGLDDIKDLPPNERKEAMKNLVTTFKGAASATGAAFDASWDKANEAFQRDMDKQLDKMINNLKQGSNEAGQPGDFDRLKELSKKEINGTITDEEKQELKQQVDNCSRHRKQYFFQSSADHREDADYAKTVDTLEKAYAGGKNLEEWKMEQKELEDAFRNNRINEQEYQQQQTQIQRSIQQAEEVRDIRKQADDFVNSNSNNTNANNLKQAFVDKCTVALEEANRSGDPTAIATATENLRIAEQFDTTLETNKSFKNGIKTFTNGQNERLCYFIDVDQVKSNLQHIYEQPNVEDITVNGKKIFSNMKISEYDRLNRVLNDYGPNGKDLVTAATKLANDPDFNGKVNTPHDIASITEAISTNMKNIDRSVRQQYLENLASGAGTNYESFRQTFNERIATVDALDPTIKSQWGSVLSMTYHWWKHETDFGSTPLTHEQYFKEYANNLFTAENMTVQSHSQSGLIRQTYMRSFGNRIHVGFTAGVDATKASQYGKPDTR